MVVGCALDNLQFALAQGNGFRILAVDMRIAGRQLGSNVSVDDILVDQQRFIEVYPELNDILTDKKQREILVRIDFNDLLTFAKYFVDVTELLNAKKTPTIRLVMPLKERLIDLSQQDAADSQVI
ncbi:unnamed protein product [Rotaria magnacalcarata]|uniref:Uncharacterized protein n=1 Tax=Rotaria magnacalcarata TaxID=392030 RepID=A0A816VGZ6_9BILA|nr:unnamed protein product [Rotaria magnacalcarata]